MTQHLDVEELQNLLKTVVDETTSITETLANKASKILSKHASEKNADIKLSTSERAALQKEIKKHSLRAIIVKVRVLQAIVRQLKMSKTIGH